MPTTGYKTSSKTEGDMQSSESVQQFDSQLIHTAGKSDHSSADAGEVVAALPFGGELAEEALHGFVLGGVGG